MRSDALCHDPQRICDAGHSICYAAHSISDAVYVVHRHAVFICSPSIWVRGGPHMRCPASHMLCPAWHMPCGDYAMYRMYICILGKYTSVYAVHIHMHMRYMVCGREVHSAWGMLGGHMGMRRRSYGHAVAVISAMGVGVRTCGGRHTDTRGPAYGRGGRRMDTWG